MKIVLKKRIQYYYDNETVSTIVLIKKPLVLRQVVKTPSSGKIVLINEIVLLIKDIIMI